MFDFVEFNEIYVKINLQILTIVLCFDTLSPKIVLEITQILTLC